MFDKVLRTFIVVLGMLVLTLWLVGRRSARTRALGDARQREAEERRQDAPDRNDSSLILSNSEKGLNSGGRPAAA